MSARLEQDVVERLLADQTVAALVGDRIVPDVASGETLPCIVWQRLATRAEHSVGAPQHPVGESVVLSFHCVARRHAEAVDVAEALVAALCSLDGYAVTIGGEYDLYDVGPDTRRRVVDVVLTEVLR